MVLSAKPPPYFRLSVSVKVRVRVRVRVRVNVRWTCLTAHGARMGGVHA